MLQNKHRWDTENPGRRSQKNSARSLYHATAVIIILVLQLILSSCGNTPTQTGISQTKPATPTPVPTPTPTSVPTAAAQDPANWFMYHKDAARTGFIVDTPDPHQLSLAWNTPLDGAVYAEPLVVNGHVIVATENDTLYALDAATGQVQWHTNVGKPVPRSALPCGNINPLGITGTPVYDPASNLIFAVAEVSGPAHILVGVDVQTGALKVQRSADPPGMNIVAHQERGALAILQGTIYIPYGGLWGDCGSYHGWVVASHTDGQGPLLSYQVPTTREGGIWTPPGPVIDTTNNTLYVSVGNGEAESGAWDHSDSVLRLSSSLQLEDGFAPRQWGQDNARDADLGSASPVLFANGLIFAAGKSGQGYLLHANALGGVGGQALEQNVCVMFGGAAVVGSQAFLPCTDGLRQITVGPGTTLNSGWKQGAVNGSPIVGGHTVYSVASSGTLYALASDSGAVRATISIPATSRFATPTLSGQTLFVGTMAGVCAVKLV